MAHDHLRLHLSHGLQRHAHDDENGRTAESAVGRLREVELRDEDRRRHGDRREEQGARERESVEHAVEDEPILTDELFVQTELEAATARD